MHVFRDGLMCKSKLLVSLIVFASCLISQAVFAKPQSVEVQLVQIEAQKTDSRTNDKLYFTITEYPSEGEPRILREPMYPLHWLFKELPQIKQLSLWKGTIIKDRSVLLIFSLMEQNFPLFDTDALIGSVQVKITNKDNHIQVTWGLPRFVDQPKVEQTDTKNPKFIMFGDESQYLVKFKVLHENL